MRNYFCFKYFYLKCFLHEVFVKNWILSSLKPLRDEAPPESLWTLYYVDSVVLPKAFQKRNRWYHLWPLSFIFWSIFPRLHLRIERKKKKLFFDITLSNVKVNRLPTNFCYSYPIFGLWEIPTRKSSTIKNRFRPYRRIWYKKLANRGERERCFLTIIFDYFEWYPPASLYARLVCTFAV